MTREEFFKESQRSFASVSDLVYEYLRENIIQMQLLPGTQLNESRLSAELKVSRTPVRTAIHRLETDGLATLGYSKAATVSPLKRSEYYQIAEFRVAVEGQSAFYAAKLITPEALARLKAILLDMERGNESEVVWPLNEDRFHTLIVHSAQNPLFNAAYELYRAKIFRYRWYIFTTFPDTDEYSLTMRTMTHRAIYNALKSHYQEQAKLEAAADALLMRNTSLSL